MQFTVTVNQVNDPPTIDTPSNVTINENAGQQTVNLTGIAAGGGGNADPDGHGLLEQHGADQPDRHLHQPEFDGHVDLHARGEQLRDGHDHRHRDGAADDGGANTTSVQFTVTVNQVAAP